MAWKFQGVFLIFGLVEGFRLVAGYSSVQKTVSVFKENPLRMSINFILTSIGLIGMQVFLSWGSIYTIMAHANLFSSVCAIVIVTYRLITF